MNITFSICILLETAFMTATCGATPKDDAIISFTGSVIRSFHDQKDFPDPSEFNAPYPPKGGYITQFEFDVTQDGEPELFLRSSLIGKLSIFDVSASPARLIADDISIGSSFGVIQNKSSLTLVSYSGTTRFNQGFIRRSYQFQSSGGFTEKELKIDIETYERMREQVDQNANNGIGNLEELLLGTKDLIKISQASRILLMDYINDQTAAWSPLHYIEGYGLLPQRSVNFSDSNGSGYMDPALEDDRIRASNFDLRAARNWLRSKDKISRFNPDKAQVNRENRANTPTTSSDPRNINSSPSRMSKLRWPWITGMTVLLFGVWLMVKHRP